MKNAIILISMYLLVSCNNVETKKENSNEDTSAHTGHANMKNNEMKTMMDKMMNEMHTIKPTDNNDIDFALMMSIHHKGAVEMSDLQLKKGNNMELKNFAKQVIADQQKEIRFMKDFITRSPKSQDDDSEYFQAAMNSSMGVMMNESIIYNDVDKDYAVQMIPHHQSAVEMAKVYLEKGKDPALKKLSQDIISSQAKEISWLQTWLKNNK